MVILNFRSVCGGPEGAWSGKSTGYEATHVFVKKSALVSYTFERWRLYLSSAEWAP